MSSPSLLATARQHLVVGVSLFALLVNLGAPVTSVAQPPAKPTKQDPAALTPTASPIKHVIVISGENRSFDHVFATFNPTNGQTVSNLLSKGIYTADGKPEPNYALSAQYRAIDNTTYAISPSSKAVFEINPPVVAGGPTNPYFSSGSASSRNRARPIGQPLLQGPDYWRHRPCRLCGRRHPPSRRLSPA